MEYQFEFLENECWWGGSSHYGTQMPIKKNSSYNMDFRENAPNQTMPLFISNKGRYIWSEKPFAVEVKNAGFALDGEDIYVYEAGNTLKDAYISAMKKHFPFSGKLLPREFFKTAQYNTWIEFNYYPNQEGVLKYAEEIIDNGFEPGIFIIDEGWHGRYGKWEFDFARFPNPKKMVDRLHELGFIVMLWVTPFVCADGVDFVKNTRNSKDIFMRTETGAVAIVRWWNGYSAILNLKNPTDCEFVDSQLHNLMDVYGVDGFKFDGGEFNSYKEHSVINGKFNCSYDAFELNIAWNEFGEKYRYHEYKDTFKGGGKAVIQRLCDKFPEWEGEGINTLLPNSILQGLIGHPFICPDMIYGGTWSSFLGDYKIDEELFVRAAQCSALLPMMQFSLAPWRVLSKKSLEMVIEAANLHKKMANVIIELAEESAVNGEPIIRALEYEFPHKGYENIRDQFMLGSDILVAPVVTKGTIKRAVIFPEGKWQSEDGEIFDGNKTYTVSADIDTLPWYRRLK